MAQLCFRCVIQMCFIKLIVYILGITLINVCPHDHWLSNMPILHIVLFFSFSENALEK